jgi:hypothetical protein
LIDIFLLLLSPCHYRGAVQVLMSSDESVLGGGDRASIATAASRRIGGSVRR